MPKWNCRETLPSSARPIRGSPNIPRTGCWLSNGFTGQPYDHSRGFADAVGAVVVGDTRASQSPAVTVREARAAAKREATARRTGFRLGTAPPSARAQTVLSP